MLRIHETNPSTAVEEAYFRIRLQRMTGMPVHNTALVIEAVDFQRWRGHWLGVVVTSWHMSVLLIPGQEEGWVSVGDNQRRFIKFPAGNFAFLGGEEPELGEFQSCSLFSPMSQFASQAEAVLAARTALSLMLQLPAQPETKAEDAKDAKSKDGPSLSRRRLFGLR